MDHQVTTPFAVRSYEIDSYGHLNNGVYIAWLEEGRHDYLVSLGFSYDGFAERHQWIVVARTEVDFKAPLHMGESVELVSRIDHLGRTSCRFVQVMHRAGKPEDVVCRGTTIMVFSGDEGPVPIPDDVRAAVEGT